MARVEEERSGLLSFFRKRGESEHLEPAPGLAKGALVGDFRLVALLGQGGMGQVWEAEQLALKRSVALKFVRPERVTAHQLELFAREARAGGRLHHPGIVTVYGHGQSDGLAWIAMEFVGGAWTLKDFLDEAARREEVPAGYDRHAARFVAEIADAMQAAHEAGVIHRDLKPQNVLITSDDHPKVTDFGLARLTDEAALSVTGDFAGTYFYMSPEQILAKRMGIDHRTDVFSLGVVLYELLALQRPFQGDTGHQVVAQIATKDPPDPRTFRSRVPRDLAVIANHALEKDRDKRYQTMQELAADLRRFLAGEPILARPPTRRDRTLKWVKRNPAKSTVAAVVLLALLVISALLLENVRANRELAAKTVEAEARRTEAEHRAEEVLRLSAFQRLEDLTREADLLWPAALENVPRYGSWLSRARELVGGLEPRGADRGYRAQLAALRERAVILNAEEREAVQRSHPRFAELDRLQRKITALKAAQAEREGKAEPTAFELGRSGLPSDADGLSALAWPLVDPQRAEYGREAEGLALARLAIERVENDEQAARAGNTLAWALLVNGLDDQALTEAAASLAVAPAHMSGELKRTLPALQAAIADSAVVLATLSEELPALEAEVSSMQVFLFADKQESWWHNQLEKLVSELEGFADPRTGLIDGVSPEQGWGIERRKVYAESIAERSLTCPDAARRWAQAIASIGDARECPAYDGLRITPQLGLLPIGRDAQSGLWEFAHLLSGEPPRRGSDGKLLLTEEMGIVLVLLPGGTFWMGAQKSDPAGQNYDPQAEYDESPVHEVRLSPFLLSKFEMTQGQWERFNGRNPSLWGPRWYEPSWNAKFEAWSALHPVEFVSWKDCQEPLARMGLELPSEARWEYAARAGTETPWWTGDGKETLQGAGNLCDAFARTHMARWLDGPFELQLDDGYHCHSAVGAFRANPFGLHDVAGNVAELCADGYDYSGPDRNFYAYSPWLDPVAPTQPGKQGANRTARGGHYYLGAPNARSAFRWAVAFDKDGGLGLRPARDIEP